MESELFQQIRQTFEQYFAAYSQNQTSGFNWIDNTKWNEKIQQIQKASQIKGKLDDYENIGFGQLYYMKAVIQDSPKSLITAISYIQKCECLKQQTILWKLQSAALYSAFKKHAQSFNIAEKVMNNILEILEQYKKQNPLIEETMKRFQGEYEFSSVWLYNSSKNLQAFKYSSASATGHYFPDNFCIADIMSLSITPLNKLIKKIEQKSSLNFANLIIYLSIACFTKATQKYYMKDNTFHHYHVKAIALAKIVCSQKCAYIQFLQTTLVDHFGNLLSSIPEQNSQIFQLKRFIPKDQTQVSLKNLDFDQF